MHLLWIMCVLFSDIHLLSICSRDQFCVLLVAFYLCCVFTSKQVMLFIALNLMIPWLIAHLSTSINSMLLLTSSPPYFFCANLYYFCALTDGWSRRAGFVWGGCGAGWAALRQLARWGWWITAAIKWCDVRDVCWCWTVWLSVTSTIFMWNVFQNSQNGWWFSEAQASSQN